MAFMPKHINIYLVGPMAVGKTTIGRNLAKSLSLEFYDSDELIEKQTGASIAWIFDIEGEAGFRERESKVIEDITQQQNIVLATGGGTVITPSNRHFLSTRGTVFFLYTDLDVLFLRTRQDDKRPLLQTKDVPARIKELWEERLPLYKEVADHQIKTSDKSVRQVCDEIIEYLQSQNVLASKS